MVTTATQKGQIVIPVEVRRRLGIKAGTRFHVEFDERENRIVLRPITRQTVEALAGMFKGRGIMEEYLKEKKKERKREDR